MIWRWGFYGLLLAFSAYESIVYENILLSMVFVMILIWPLFSMAILLIQHRGLKVDMKIPVPLAEKGSPIQVQLVIEKKGFMPLMRLDGELQCFSAFDGSKSLYPVSMSVDGGQQCQYVYELSMEGCGKYRLLLPAVRLWDYFHFFSIKKKLKLSADLTFLPGLYETAVTVCESTRHFAGETEDYEPEAAGLDHSQIYQVRPYRPGDRLQMIHWKLTARNNELFVREASEPVSFAVGIFMDLSTQKAENRAADSRKAAKGHRESRPVEAMIEAVLSISNELLEQRCRHFIVWYDAEEDRLIKRKIGKIEDIYETMDYMLTVKTYPQEAPLPAMYRERYPYGLYAVALEVDLSGRIRKGEIEVGRFDGSQMADSLGRLLIEI